MTHSPPLPRKLPAPHRRYRFLLAALAVMLLAVLPHVTFAASMLHGIGPPAGAAAMRQHAPAAQDHSGGHAASAPCHQQSGAEDHAQPAKPACCIIGCGLLGFGPQITMPRIVAVSHRLGPPPAWFGEGAEIEPAERPPRRG
jgi:hypothetical protein